jgi:8-oxo-dGTP pyrophosphatase MutT (NUDIX family)
MSSVGWERVRDALGGRTPARVPGSVSTRAAVAAVLREGEEGRLELLFIRRAEHESDPWSGHISFPGGRSEPGDAELVATATRETLEETGLDLRRDGELFGGLDEIQAMARARRVDLSIAPFVFRLLRPAELVPNHEVVSLHWLPLESLLGPAHRSTMEYPHEGRTLELPCLRIDGLVIWGLTYKMFDNLRELLEGAETR